MGRRGTTAGREVHWPRPPAALPELRRRTRPPPLVQAPRSLRQLRPATGTRRARLRERLHTLELRRRDDSIRDCARLDDHRLLARGSVDDVGDRPAGDRRGLSRRVFPVLQAALACGRPDHAPGVARGARMAPHCNGAMVNGAGCSPKKSSDCAPSATSRPPPRPARTRRRPSSRTSHAPRQ